MVTEPRRSGRLHRISILAVLLMIGLACNAPFGSSQQNLAYVTATAPAIPTRLLLTGTRTNTPTPTLTLTPTATWTSTPTATSTYTSTPTATLTPTLTPTFTPSLTPTYTPTIDPFFTPSLTPTPTNTPFPSPTPFATSRIPTTTAIPEGLAPNRLRNPGFEGLVRPVIFPEVNVFADWEPFYCDDPYTPEKCPAERRDTQSPPRNGYNDPDLMMGRPEFKPSDVANRIHGGKTAQQWFCFYRVCRAGVFQIVPTTAGATCEVSAWVQTWSATSTTGTDGQTFTSTTATADDRANSTWFIKVDPNGGTYAFGPGLLISQPFTYDFGHYDKYIQIRFTFTATSNQATVFFENLRLWPFPHNDSYIDDAAVRCLGS